MPYIKTSDRDRLDYITDAVELTGIKTAGELNYLITKICICFMNDEGQNYQNINNVIGALEGAKMEFYRRYAAPYEDTKIIANGDVYHV